MPDFFSSALKGRAVPSVVDVIAGHAKKISAPQTDFPERKKTMTGRKEQESSVIALQAPVPTCPERSARHPHRASRTGISPPFSMSATLTLFLY